MKKMIFALLLVCLLTSLVQAAGVQNVDSPTAQKMLKENAELYLLDVRTPQEYFQARLDRKSVV